MAHGKASARRGEVVRIWLLGGFRVSVGTRVVGEWRGRKAGSLVKLLALSERKRLHREEIIALLWPDLDAKRAANNFHRALHLARKTLAPAGIALCDGLLSLCPENHLRVDVDTFEEAADIARRTREIAAYRAAIELYDGDLLPGDLYEAWAEERRGELRVKRLSLLMELAALHEEKEEFGFAIEALRGVVATERGHEEAHVALMRAYALSGERERAVAQYKHLEKRLEELGAKPGAASRRFYEDISAGRFPPARSEVHASENAHRASERHNLPNIRTSFVGREREMAEVRRSLAMTQLLTLAGAGGCGKTRLAVEVARDLVGAYPDGVWMARLAPLSDGSLVARTVAGVLGVREQPGRSLTETLSEYLASRQMLLVLDNCEHVIGEAARLADSLLDSCGGLCILATSRETLGVDGEVVWRVSTLTSPEEGEESVEGVLRYEAARLFVDRVRAKLPAFELTEGNAHAVAEVCRRLDGIPLAIELATARAAALAVEQVADRLNDSLSLLALGNRTAEPRHRTMRATLEWSHDLLEHSEKSLFRRLSVFAGGWTLEAAEEVGGGVEGGKVLDLLEGLVDKSLVVAEVLPGESMRYRMLEPVRQYAREKLEEGGEVEEIRERHAAFFLDLAESAEPELRGPGHIPWLARLDAEVDNLRATMAWLLGKKDSETVVGIGWALWLFWFMRGHFTEGRRWMEEALESAMPESPRAKALFIAGTLAEGQSDYRSSEPWLEESVALFRDMGDRQGAALALGSIGRAAVGRGHHERAIAVLEEAMDLHLEGGKTWLLSVTTSFLAGAWFGLGDLTRAKRLAQRGLAMAREVGDGGQALCVALYTLAMISLASDDYKKARVLFAEGLGVSGGIEDESHIFYGLHGLAAIAASEGEEARAARLWGAAEALRETVEVATHIYAPDPTLHQSQINAARSALGETTFEAVWAEGRAMSSEEAVEYALGDEDEYSSVKEPAETANTLTRREREVASLVARGLSNRQISDEFGISERTVEGHVSKVLHKLGLRSRTQIAAWIVKRTPS